MEDRTIQFLWSNFCISSFKVFLFRVITTNIFILRLAALLRLWDLARIFHTNSAAACEHLTDTASALNCSSGSMKHTAVVAIHHLPCLHQDSRRLATNQYEICGLARIFHTHLLRNPRSQMDAALDSHFDLSTLLTLLKETAVIHFSSLILATTMLFFFHRWPVLRSKLNNASSSSGIIQKTSFIRNCHP
jgi:hypothetical protein